MLYLFYLYLVHIADADANERRHDVIRLWLFLLKCYIIGRVIPGLPLVWTDTGRLELIFVKVLEVRSGKGVFSGAQIFH